LLESESHSPLADSGHLGDAVGLVRGIGVRYVVVHRDAFTNPAMAATLIRTLESDPRRVAAEHRFGDTIVFTLTADGEAAADASRLVPRPAVQARASHSPERLPLLFDGDRDTRWLSAEPQSGREWIELELDAPRNVSEVRMQTAERSFADYPRELAIDAVESGGTRTLFRGSVLPQFGRGLLASLSYPYIDIHLPDNQARIIRLRQLGATDQLFWSIHELELRERSR
jgi:hypothetical protein